MTDTSSPEHPNRNKSTVDVYRDLLRVEVRALVGRVGELTQTVGDLFTEVSHIAIQLEQSSNRTDQAAGGVHYCRTELGAVKQSLSNCELQLGDLRKNMQDAESKITDLESQVATNTVLKNS